MKPKILIIGYARHGKDSVAEILRDGWGYKFCSSSMAACEKVVFPVMSKQEGYTSIEECFEDRVNHRTQWHQLISEYNTPCKGRLAKEIMETNDIYVGMRCQEELKAARRLFDVVVWVDASKRHFPEPVSSNTLTKEMADYCISNNGDLVDLVNEVYTFAVYLNRMRKHKYID